MYPSTLISIVKICCHRTDSVALRLEKSNSLLLRHSEQWYYRVKTPGVWIRKENIRYAGSDRITDEVHGIVSRNYEINIEKVRRRKFQLSWRPISQVLEVTSSRQRVGFITSVTVKAAASIVRNQVDKVVANVAIPGKDENRLYDYGSITSSRRNRKPVAVVIRTCKFSANFF